MITDQGVLDFMLKELMSMKIQYLDWFQTTLYTYLRIIILHTVQMSLTTLASLPVMSMRRKVFILSSVNILKTIKA